MATDKISIDQAHRLLAAMGLLVHQPGTTEGFIATARGGRDGTRAVKAAETIALHYHHAGAQLTGRDLHEDPQLDEIRSHYQWAVDRAPSYGYDITWDQHSARLTLSRPTVG